MAKYSPAENIRRVVVDDESLARYKAAFGTTGVLLALPHMGDWDLAGAWSCAIGVPISSVAERLPDEEFEYFMRLRSKVGMTIYSHKDPNAVEKLKEDLANHRVVALLADRDLSRHGVPVVWHTASGDRDVTMPPGPAVIAGATGVALMPAICTYERDLRMRVRFLEPIEVDTGEEGVQRTTQRLADVFCREVAAKVTDWHVLQRFFPGVVAD
jgi:KDO2-lipid IV(A) lauroyltransferase